MQASKLLGVFAASAIAVVLGGSAGAAEPDKQGTVPAASKTAGIEEIIVTSRREEESIQDVPIAVSAFTPKDLERIAPYTLVDMDGLMPNVVINQQTAGPSMGAIFIRGIGTADVEKTTPPQVGVVVDGIFQGTNTGQIIDMFDIEQIEVNRGPQGVLYGKNTTGGTIVVRRSQPVFNELKYKVSAEGGDFNEQLYKAKVNVPLIDDKLALKIGGMSSQRDGVYRNTTRQTDDGNIDYKTATAALKWQPVDELTATLSYDNIDDTGNFGIPNDPIVNGNNPWKTQANLKQTIKYNVDTWGLNVQWDLGGATLESITGYVDSKDIVQQDFDNSTLATIAIPLPQLHTLRNQNFSQTSEELRLSGELIKNVTYTVGALYFNTNLDFGQGTNQVLQLPYGAGGFGLPPIPGATCETFGLHSNPIPGVGSALCQTNGIGSWQVTNQQDLSKSLYGSINYQLTDRLQLTGGLRRIQQNISFSTEGFYPATIPAGSIQPPHGPSSTLPCGGPPCPFPIDSNNDWNKTIAEATVTFNVTDMNMVYARYAQGFRSGGYSNRGNDPAFLSFSPETADAYEIGSKNEFFDHKLQLNLTGFYTQIHDVQFGTVVTTTGVPPGTNTIVNNSSGDVETFGFEMQSTWLINDLFSLIATYGYQDNKSDKFSLSSQRLPFNPGGSACNPVNNPGLFPAFPPSKTPNNCPSIELGGGDFARAPKYNYSVTGVYTQDFGPYSVSLNVTSHGVDDYFINGRATSGGASVEQKAYSLVDARAAVQWNMNDGNLLRLSLVGKNLNEKEYIQEDLPLGNGGFTGWGPPRTIALELLYQH